MTGSREQEPVEDLVAEFLERREEGQSLDAEAFAAEHPEAGAELIAALRAALEAETLFPDSASLIGQPSQIGPWQVVGELGRGGAGRVFRVVRGDQPEREFALKVLDFAIVGGERALERFRREGAILEQLEHEGIVRVREVAIEAERPYLVMDRVEGPSLSQVLSSARIARRTSRADTPPTDVISLPGEGSVPTRAARLAAGLARAVAFAHERSLLHRDLKPSNVLLDGAGRPVLADFGLAVQEGSATLTASGDVLGTPNYMSPEQARGERADPRTDVWGVGAVLYELLTLQPPHGGEETLEVLERIRRRPVAPVRRVNPAVPRALARIVHRALAWRPARRYATAAELAEDLDAFVAGGAPKARARGLLEWSEDTVRFRPRLVTTSALAVLAVVVGFTAVRGAAPIEPAGPSISERIAVLERELDLAWLDGELEDLGGPALRLLELDPTSAVGRAFSQLASGEPLEVTGDEGVDLFAQAARHYEARQRDEARELADRALSADPTWVLPIAMKGFIALRAAEREPAESELMAARRLLPESLQVTRDLAFLMRTAGRPSEAATELERILVIHPNDAKGWSDLAASLALDKRSDEALVAIERAIELGETTPKVFNRKAAILDGLGRSDEATALFREVLADWPNDPTVVGNLAFTLDGECLLSEAREAYKRVLEIEPKDLKALTGLAYLAAGSNRAECAACERAFEADASLYDPKVAAFYAAKIVEVDRANTEWTADFAVRIAHRVDRKEEVREALEALLDAESEVNERVVRVERALRKL
jgi:Flp pilus assembly protein TadD/tRNA A-37 threonylcarbamoyl transferase component Bud32